MTVHVFQRRSLVLVFVIREITSLFFNFSPKEIFIPTPYFRKHRGVIYFFFAIALSCYLVSADVFFILMFFILKKIWEILFLLQWKFIRTSNQHY